MPAETTPHPSLSVVLERVLEVKVIVDDTAKQLQALRELYLVAHQQIVDQVGQHEKTLGEHHTAIKDLQKAVGPLVAAYKILVFISGAVGLSVIALIWAIITHSVTISMP